MIPTSKARCGYDKPRPPRVLDGHAVHMALRLHSTGVLYRWEPTRKVAPGGRIQARIGVQVQGSQHADGVHVESTKGEAAATRDRSVKVAGVYQPVAFGRCRPRGVRVRGGVELFWCLVGAAGVHAVRVFDPLLANVEPGVCVSLIPARRSGMHAQLVQYLCSEALWFVHSSSR